MGQWVLQVLGLVIPANTEWLGIKRFYIAKYPSDEDSVVQNFRAVDQVVLETSIFQSIIKIP